MYERFFGLRERPFDLTPNPRFLVMTEGHREALSNLEYAILGRKGITVLLGDAGCGKTTIIRTAIDRQSSRVHCVHVTNPALTRGEFVEVLATHFGLTEDARQSKATMLRELDELLRRRRDADETTVLVIDEAQSLSNELLEEIRLLANIETDDDKLVSLILAGQPELSRQLDQDSLRQFKQRIALRCELRPLTLQETLGYLAGRVRAAGGVASRIFTREAATLMYEYSGGIPRLINVLADNALLAAFGKQKTQITSDLVAGVAADFNLQRSTTVTAHAPGASAGPPTAPSSTHADGAEATPTLMAITDVSEPGQFDAPITDPETPSSTSALFGTFSTKRRFPFLGRRGTA